MRTGRQGELHASAGAAGVSNRQDLLQLLLAPGRELADRIDRRQEVLDRLRPSVPHQRGSAQNPDTPVHRRGERAEVPGLRRARAQLNRPQVDGDAPTVATTLSITRMLAMSAST